MPETPTQYDGTIDWNDYWADADGADREGAAPSARYVVDPLLALLDRRGAPDSLADVGCGPGAVSFAAAEAYPDAEVVGYDAAPAVLERNRERAAAEGADVAFEAAVLPAFDPGRTFDVVERGGDEYGALYFLTDRFEDHRDVFDRITEEMD